MKILTIIALALCAACAGKQAEPAAPTSPIEDTPPPLAPPEPGPEPEMEYFTEDLETDENLIPALQIGAQQLECALVAEEGQKVVYECPLALIVIVQSGTELRYVCERSTPDACQQLMSDIIDAVLRAAEAG